jgi:methyltransferase-like protein
MSAIIHRNTQQPFVLSHSHTGITTTVDHGRYGKFILKYLDGKRTIAEIFSLVRQEDKFRRAPPSDETLFDDFKGLYTFFNAIERLLLKRR